MIEKYNSPGYLKVPMTDNSTDIILLREVLTAL